MDKGGGKKKEGRLENSRDSCFVYEKKAVR